MGTGGDQISEGSNRKTVRRQSRRVSFTDPDSPLPQPGPCLLVEVGLLPVPTALYTKLVPAPSLDQAPVRVNASIPKAALAEIDEKARAHGFIRSGFLAHVTLTYHQDRQ